MQATRVVTAVRMAPLWRPLATRLRALHGEHVSCAAMNARSPSPSRKRSVIVNATVMIFQTMLTGSSLDRSFVYQSLLASALTESV